MKKTMIDILIQVEKGNKNAIDAHQELLDLFGVSKSVCDCSEADRVEEDGELYCIKCGSKWD